MITYCRVLLLLITGLTTVIHMKSLVWWNATLLVPGSRPPCALYYTRKKQGRSIARGLLSAVFPSPSYCNYDALIHERARYSWGRKRGLSDNVTSLNQLDDVYLATAIARPRIHGLNLLSIAFWKM